MSPSLKSVILLCASLASALPNAVSPRAPAVTALNQAAFEEAQQRDNTATRAFSNTQIKTSDGKCLFVDELSGDFRANLTPIKVGTCDGSKGQQWDVLTSGKHNNVPGQALVVSALTQACVNFDPRRAAGNQVLLFSCGGRADGGGLVTDSQLFPFSDVSGPVTLSPKSSQGATCLTVKGNVVDQAACEGGDASQSFTFGGDGGSGGSGNSGTATESSPEASSSAASSLATPSATPSACEPQKVRRRLFSIGGIEVARVK